MLKDIFAYIAENIEIIIIVAVIAAIVTCFAKGVGKILSIIAAVVILVLALQFFGVPMANITNKIKDEATSIIDGSKNPLEDLFDSIKDGWNDLFGAKDTGQAESVAFTELGGGVEVHFLDVGQADCIFIDDGDTEVLVDCGNYGDAAFVTDYLNGLGVESLDYFIVTHPHEDHIGCAATILRVFEVGSLVKNGAEAGSVCYTKMMEEAAGTNIIYVEPGDVFELETAVMQIIGSNEGADDANETSIVSRLVCGEVSFLFAGDAGRESELAILDAGYDVSADVLKVGHHGSAGSTTYPWLRAIMPEYAVIMVGADNDYGHPTDDVLSKLRDADATVYRTDLNGTIVMETDGREIRVSSAA